ncbi:phosphoenolpyruvate carboxylase, partial [Alteromonas stellipolaris]
MHTHYDAELKDTVRYLGKTLGETIKNQLGQEWLDRIEKIRKDGRASYQGDTSCSDELKETFKTMTDSDLLTVGRAFAQFLNLGNIAEQEYNSAMNVDASIDALFKHLD